MSESKVLKLEIALSETTERKLRSLAMLSPEAAQQIEQRLTDHLQSELSEYFDRTVTAEILHYMSEIDGKQYGDVGEQRVAVQPEAPEPVAETKLEKLDDAPLPNETDPNGTDHGLSEDEDTQDNKSAEEQAEELAQKLARGEPVDVPGIPVQNAEIAAPQVDFADADEDAEAFLDVALEGKPQPKPKAAPMPIQRPSGPMEREAEDSFDPRKRQASISAYGGKDAPTRGNGWYP
jgi:hypothetical protein